MYIYIYIEYLWVIIPKNPLTLVAFLVGRVFATKGAAFGGLATAQLETSEVQPGGEPTGSMGLVYLPTFAIHLSEM